MVRRIEALELKITKAAPLEKVQRLTRRVEGLDSRLLLKAAPQPQVVLPTSSTREKELEKEVESLRVAYKDLKDEMKSIQNEMKEMMEKMKALPATIANVCSNKNYLATVRPTHLSFTGVRGQNVLFTPFFPAGCCTATQTTIPRGKHCRAQGIE